MARSCCCSTNRPTDWTPPPPAHARIGARDRGLGGPHLLSSHLLRDVESCCDEVIVLRDGKVATIANLAAERASQRRFLEIETRGGDNGQYPSPLAELGCEVASFRTAA